MSIKGHHTVTVVITLVLLSVRHGVIVTVIDNLTSVYREKKHPYICFVMTMY